MIIFAASAIPASEIRTTASSQIGQNDVFFGCFRPKSRFVVIFEAEFDILWVKKIRLS